MGKERILLVNDMLHAQYSELEQLNLEECIDLVKEQVKQTEQLRRRNEELEKITQNERTISEEKIHHLQSEVAKLEQHLKTTQLTLQTATSSSGTATASMESRKDVASSKVISETLSPKQII